jgi:urease accessory protein
LDDSGFRRLGTSVTVTWFFRPIFQSAAGYQPALQYNVILQLRLQQFADSALPIGGAAHSFGIESLVDGGLLDANGLESFLGGYIEETGALEAAYCAASCELAGAAEPDLSKWVGWNIELAARKLARESRDASAAMGRRFLDLAARASNLDLLWVAHERTAEIQLATAFGLVAGAMGLGSGPAAAAFLQQSVTALVSCCQRLLPLGQTRAHEILWNLKPAIVEAASRGARTPPASAPCFTPLLEVASARHPKLHTRLFIS